MNDSDAVRIPVAIAIIVLTICVVLLLSLAITCVFFDRNGYLRRRRSPTRSFARHGRDPRPTELPTAP